MKEDIPRILIVDDEEYIRASLTRVMKTEGFEVHAAHDGHMTLKMIQEELPEVLLVDFKMPGMDGMELLRRAKELYPDLPVILITAYADVQGAVDAMRAGAHDYLAKPFDHHEVIRVVRRALAERQEPIHGLMPEGRDNLRPTIPRILKAFAHYSIVHICSSNLCITTGRQDLKYSLAEIHYCDIMSPSTEAEGLNKPDREKDEKINSEVFRGCQVNS